MTNKKLHNITETGKLLGVSKAKVYNLINRGFLTALDLGGLKVADAEIDRFIASYAGYSFKDMNDVRPMH